MTIADYDHLEATEKRFLLIQCCGSQKWVDKMIGLPPAEDLIDLFEDAEEMWYKCNEDDWKEAFTHHPMIGDIDSLRKKFSNDQFAAKEQASINDSSEKTLQALAEGNHVYQQKFGYIFIVFATNKVIGIAILPFIVGLTFMGKPFYDMVFSLSLCMLAALFVYRFYLSFVSVRKQVSINFFHFILYIVAFEIAPLLLINKLLVSFFSETH